MSSSTVTFFCNDLDRRKTIQGLFDQEGIVVEFQMEESPYLEIHERIQKLPLFSLFEVLNPDITVLLWIDCTSSSPAEDQPYKSVFYWEKARDDGKEALRAYLSGEPGTFKGVY